MTDSLTRIAADGHISTRIVVRNYTEAAQFEYHLRAVTFNVVQAFRSSARAVCIPNILTVPKSKHTE